MGQGPAEGDAASGCPTPSAALAGRGHDRLRRSARTCRRCARNVRATFFESIIASYQRADHLPIAAGPAVLRDQPALGVLVHRRARRGARHRSAAALLARRCLRGQAPTWTLPLMIFAWTIVTTLYQPAITPDQPVGQPQARARRAARLHPAGGLGLGLAASAGSGGWASPGWSTPAPSRACVRGSWCCPPRSPRSACGSGSGGPVGIRLAADGLASKTTYDGRDRGGQRHVRGDPARRVGRLHRQRRRRRSAAPARPRSSAGCAASRRRASTARTCPAPWSRSCAASSRPADGRCSWPAAPVAAHPVRRPDQADHERCAAPRTRTPSRPRPLHTVPLTVNVWMSEPTP